MLPVFVDEVKSTPTILFCKDWLYILCINRLILATACTIRTFVGSFAWPAWLECFLPHRFGIVVEACSENSWFDFLLHA